MRRNLALADAKPFGKPGIRPGLFACSTRSGSKRRNRRCGYYLQSFQISSNFNSHSNRADPGNLITAKEFENMPNADGEKPGGDDTAGTKSGEQNGDAAGKKAGSKSGDDDDDSDDDDEPSGKPDDKSKAGQIVFKSQADLDKIIQKRVDRALKKSEDEAKLSKEQLLEKERDDAKAEVRERDLKDDFELASGLEKAKATRLFKMYRDDMDVDDKGKVTNMKDVVKQAKADFPEMFQTVKGKGDGGGGSGDGSGKVADGDMNSTLRKMAGRG